jgi:hypothetical protein
LWPKGLRPLGIPGRSAEGRPPSKRRTPMQNYKIKKEKKKLKKNLKKKNLLLQPKHSTTAIKSPCHNVKLLNYKIIDWKRKILKKQIEKKTKFCQNAALPPSNCRATKQNSSVF